MTHLSATAAKRRQGRRFLVPVIAVLAVAMIGAVMTLAGSAPSAQAQIDNTTCYTINDGEGTMTSWTSGTQTVVGDTGLTAVEALSANQDRNELWTYDDATSTLYTFVPGSAVPTAAYPTTFDGGDLDSLTWVNHTDGDPSNDELWGTFRNPLSPNDGPNFPDSIAQIDLTTGQVVAGSEQEIDDPGAGTSNEQDDNDGLIWDPQTGNYYGVIGGDTTDNLLIVIDPATGSIISTVALTQPGGGILDIESLGAGTDGQLYGTTGEDGPDANQFVAIDKTFGAVTVIGAYDTIIDPVSGLNTNVDYEATACLTTVPLTVGAAVCYTIDEGNGLDDNHLVRVDIATDATFTFTDLGIVNNGDTPPVNTLNIESIAYRNGFEPRPLYTFDPATNDLIRISITDGTDVVQIPTNVTADIDGLTFRNDNDNDPSNDELWAIIRRAGTPNLEDQLIQIDPDTGQTIGAPITITTGGTGSENDVDGLAWDPATDTFYAPVNGNGADNELITIDPVTGAVTVVGLMGVQDVEGIGFTDDGELFGSTGADGPPSNSFLYIDKATGEATDLGTIPIYADFEALDCAGVVPPLLGSISNFVFEDLDGDGVQDPTEPGVAGATVTLLDGNGDPVPGVPAQVTGADGLYLFDDLPEGDYIVEFTPPVGRELTTQDAGGDDTADSDPDPATDQTAIIPLGAGEDNVDVDAGIAPLLGSLGNFVFEDLDQDGVQDLGEPGVAGATVTLLDEFGVPVPGVPAQVTGADGLYTFTDLPAGTYIVDVEPPAGRTFTAQDAGADDTLDSDVDTGTGQTGLIVLDPGEDDPSNDAGILPLLASLGNFVFEDLDQDGVQDLGEPGVAGATVTLLDEFGVPVPGVPAQVTGADGLYMFTDLPAGTYIVDVVPPAGRTFTAQDAGADDTLDSDVDTGTGETGLIVLDPGENDPSNDAGILPLLGSISNFVFEDLDGDGVQDPTEPGVAGATVTLLDGNGDPVPGVPAQVTGADGLYLFDDLPEGDYIVEFTPPVGRELTTQDAGGDDTADSDPDPATDQTAIIPLGAGEDNVDVDAGIAPLLGSISNFVFEDLDGDGVQDPTEPGVAGATVTLLDGNGDPVPGVPAQVTGADGLYLFDDLPEGDYIVEFTPPVGRELTTQDAGGDDTADSDPDPATDQTAIIPLGAGEDNVDVDAGIAPLLGSLGNFVFEDLDQDGVQDLGEPGVAGATVTLLDEFGVPVPGVPAQVTGADGLYTFTDLPAGTYIVDVVPPAGRTFTAQDAGADDTLDSDVDTGTGETGLIVLDPGEDDPSNDAGILPLLGSISNFVFEDLDGDGVQDPTEPGVAGATVTLLDGNGDPVPGVPAQVTGADGLYLFDDLPEGDYIVEFTPPVGRELTTQDAGGDDTADSDPDPATDQTAIIPLGAGEDNVDVDAGIAPLLGSISNFVFEDLDGDGVQDPTEPGVAGATVTLLDGNGDPVPGVPAQVTGADGLYLFDDLPAGDYIVQFEAPVGRELTTANAGGDDAADSDPDPATGQTAIVNLDPGEDDPTVDAGIAPLLGSISNFVFEDLDGDGVQDPTEPGVAGATVTLLDGNGDPVPGVPAQVTGADGLYLFDDLPEGDYIVEFTPPVGRELTTQDAGGDDTADSDPDPATDQTAIIPLGAGEDNVDVDAGIAPLLGSISNFVFEDLDGDGVQDPTEPGVAGATVTLLDGNGDPVPGVPAQVTGADGLYLFDDLPEGDYIVEFTPPVGRELTTQDAGGDDTADSDPDPATDQTAIIPLGAGEDNVDVDAGIAPLIPAIGLAKDLASGPTRIGQTDTYDVSYSFIIENIGEVDLTGVTLTDNVAVGLAGTTASVVSGPTPNAAGDCSTEVALGTQALAVGESCTAVWDFVITNPGGAAVAFDNSATVEGTPPTGPAVTDTSDDGAVTDTDGDGNADEPGENDPTPAEIPALASLGDKVWEDTNGNDIDDDGANGIPGVTVNLLDENGVSTGLSTTTDADGLYSFDNLDAGTYIVEFVEPADRDFVTQDAGADDTIDSDADVVSGQTAPVTLAAGDNDPTIDAGMTPPPVPVGSISNLVFEDLDGDGVQDPTEPGIAGVTVTLLDGNGDPVPGVPAQVTGADGLYIFGDLPAGDYIVEFTPPVGRELTTQDAGGDDTADSDPDPATNQTAIIPLAEGEDNVDVDAGIAPLEPAIGLAKDLASGPTLRADGDYDVSYSFVIENIGEVDLTNVTLTDNVAVGLAGTTASVVSGPTPNAAGDCSTEVALGTQALAVGESCTAVWDFVITNPGGAAVAFDNSATVEGTPPTGPAVTDTSDDGAVTDTDGDGNADEPGENDPTPAEIPALPLGSISNFVFEDLDGDGVQDPTEPGVAGATVTLLDGNGDPVPGVPAQVTGADGLYLFDDLPEGDYIVEFTPPVGRELTTQDAGGDDTADSDPDPATDQTAIIPLGAGEDNVDVDAGIAPLLGSISNFVFEDLDGDGVQDPTEPGVAGATVTLLDGNGDPVPGVPAQVTGADGLYLFDDLPEGDYIVEFTPPVGRELTTQDAGGDDTADSDPDPATDQTAIIPLGAGEDNVDVDAGIAPLLGSISNFVFEDLDGDGVQDPTEPGVAGATVTLLDGNGDPVPGVPAQVTGADGLYIFDDLPAGDYIVQFEAPVGRELTTANAGGDDAADSDPDPATGQTAIVNLDPGEDDPTVDAGIAPLLGSISNFVFEDLDGDGVQDPTEPGVAGATVTLLDGNGDPVPGVPAQITGADGLYIFDDLPEGDYIVDFEAPVGRELTTQDAGGDDTADSDPDPATGQTAIIPLGAGEDNVDVDAGIAGLASLGDKVWEDTNGNDIDDDGANGIPGVTVNLLDENGVSTGLSTTTDADGLYSFDNLDAGTYIVEFVEPADRDFVTQDAGADDTIDSDADVVSGQTAPVTLAAGDNDPTIDAGMTPPPVPVGSISNLVFEDLDGDGVQDPTEPGIAGVTVTLLDGNGDPVPGVPAQVTGADGLYIFGDLPAGDYIVEFTPPVGRELTTQDAGGDDTADSDPDPATNQTAIIPLAEGEDNVDVDAGIAPLEPAIGLAKDLASGPTLRADGDYDVSYSFIIENIGEVDLTNVTLTDNVAVGLAGTTASVVSGPTPNAAGDCSTEVALGTQALAVGESCTAVWDFVITNPGGAAVAFDNSATVEGTPPTGPAVTDTSDDGAVTDTDGDGNADEPGENDPTPAEIPAVLLGSISNFVWEDDNGDGIQDPTEPGVDGVLVTLLDGAGVAVPGVAPVTTTGGGLYSFDDLPAGDYIVEFTAPVDRTFTTPGTGDGTNDSDADPTTGQTAVIALGAGEDYVDADAGIAPTARIGNFLWRDDNRDGIQDLTEPGIEGVDNVTVWNTNAAGDLLSEFGTFSTDEFGEWGADVPPGNYRVVFDLPAGAESFTLMDVGDDAADSDVDVTVPNVGFTDVYTIANGDDNQTIDAGVIYPFIPATLGNFVWEDTNGNGIQDETDTGIQGVVVEVYDDLGALAGSTTTGPDGEWSVTVPPGTYTVTFINTTTGDFTTPNVGGDDATDSDADPATGETAPVTLAEGESNLTIDAGIVFPAPAIGLAKDLASGPTRIGQTDTYDVSYSFIIENIGEVDLTNVTLTDNVGVGLAGTTASVVSGPTPNAAGDCSTEVALGTQALAVGESCTAVWDFVITNPGGAAVAFDNSATVEGTPPTGPAVTDTSDDGAVTDTDGDGNADEPGENDPTPAEIPALPLGSISNLVFEDLDGDGIQDPGEPGLAGVTVTLLDSNGDPIPGIDPVVTAADGTYIFGDLPAGDYIVEFTAPDGTEFSPQNTGDGTDDSDAGPDGLTGVISLGIGEDNVDVDAGIVALEPAIGLAKDLASGPTRIGQTDTYDVSYSFIIENIGEVDLTGVTLTDNVGVGLAGTTASVVSGPTPNAAGDCSTEVALGTQALAVGESCTAVWDFVITNPGGAAVAFDNSATVEGTPPTGPAVTDTSDDGAVTDTDGDGNADEPGENDPTPAEIPALLALGDKVWEDTNGNNIDDDGANGIAGITVNLLDENGVATGLTTTTDADGNYLFENLDAGTYIVEFIEPADRDFVTQDAGADDTIDSDAAVADGRTAPVTLTTDDLTVDAGMTPPPAPVGSISNLVFDDLDGDGIQDPGEPGLAGVTVTLLDSNGDPIPGIDPVVTAADGTYIFGDLPAGDYIVEFTAPDGRAFSPQDAGDGTNDSDAGTDGLTGVISLDAGEDNVDVDAGIAPLPLGSISNLVFDDLDGDGIQDPGEPGLAGVTVTLLDSNGDPIPGIDPVVTAADGTYIFGDLPAGDYIVEFTAPDGRAFSPQDAGDGTNDSDAGTDGLTGVISLDVGEDNVDVDAGIAPLVPAIGLAKALTAGPTEVSDGQYSLSYTFVIENLGEVALTDVGIADNFVATFAGATLVSGPTPGTTGCSATAAAGTATLAVGESCTAVWEVVVTDVTPGETYNNTATATGTAPNGVEVSDISDDGTVTDPDGDGNGNEAGENDPTPATIPPPPDQAVIGDKVWNDANGDGIQDPGEEPVAGVVVQIRRPDGSGLIEVITDADGMWSATLDPGDYDITFVLPDGFAFSPQGTGGDPEADSNVLPNGQTARVTLGAGEVNNSIDAGLVPLGSLGNRVFSDLNSNGIQDPGEPSVPGATVQLFAANAAGAKGALLGTQVTAADGTYLFDDLPAGDYIIVVTPPAGFVLGPQDTGVDDDLDNDVDPATGESGVIRVGIGANIDNVDAGVVPAVVVPPTTPAAPPLGIVNITNAPGPAPAPAPAPPAPPLALTGSNSNVLATLAIAMMVVGGTLLIGARREGDKE